MKATFVLFGLAALIGATMAMSLLDHQFARLNKRQGRQGSGSGSGVGSGSGSGMGSGSGSGMGSGSGSGMGSGSGSGMGIGQGSGQGKGPGKGGRRPGKGGKGDKGGEERAFSSLLAFSALAAKCEILDFYISYAADEANMTYDEIAAGVGMVAPTLASACPELGKFVDIYSNGTEESREVMLKCMAPYGVLLQCTNLFAELDTMRLIGFTNSSEDGTPESQLMVHGQPLMDACMEIFGAAADAEKELEEDLNEVEEAGEEENETRELRALLKKLEDMLARK